jgi:hypothetical protein
MVLAVTESIVPIMNAVALLLITAFGLWMILAEDENTRTKARNVVVTVIISIILLNLAYSIYQIYINYDSGGDAILTDELLGLIRFVETPLAVIALLAILVTGIRAIITFGGQDSLSKIRDMIISVCLGLILLTFKYAIAADFTQTFRPYGTVDAIMTVVNMITFFIGTLAVAVIVYAAFLMILNVGNDEQYTRAKGIILRVFIGILVILSASAIVNAILETNIFNFI